jgi:hypothetical protein
LLISHFVAESVMMQPIDKFGYQNNELSSSWMDVAPAFVTSLLASDIAMQQV